MGNCKACLGRGCAKDSIKYADTLHNIGNVYSDQGNPSEALKYYQRNLEIYERINGKDSINSADTLNNIGNVYCKQKDYPKAL